MEKCAKEVVGENFAMTHNSDMFWLNETKIELLGQELTFQGWWEVGQS